MNERKPKTPHDDPAQSKRFIDMARKIGADERPEAVDEAFKKVIPLKTHVAPDTTIGRKTNGDD